MKPTTRKILKEYALAITLAVMVGYLIRGFGVETYRVSGSEMSPTLVPGELVFVAKWPLLKALIKKEPWVPQRGDIVVLSDSMRRVVGLPGDVMEPEDVTQGQGGKTKVFTSERVPVGSIFVMGDEKTSRSARNQFKGLVPLTDIKGKVLGHK